MASRTLTLKQCAERLGVHYMTAYRYVRLGRLPATKVAGEWRVLPADLETLLAVEAMPREAGPVDWSGRLEDRMLAGDLSGSWSVIESALASGVTPDQVHVDMLSPALSRIDQALADGEATLVEERMATAVATKLVGRMFPRFARRGRRRGRIVIGTPPGDRNSLRVAIVADLLRGAGWDVAELGADLPVADFIQAVEKFAPVSAVAVSASSVEVLVDARQLIAALKDAFVAPVVVGAAGIDHIVANDLGADGWASDGRTAVEAVAAVVT